MEHEIKRDFRHTSNRTSEAQWADEAQVRLAAIVDTSDDAIIGKALDGTILSWNQGAQRIYGYSTEEVVGRSVSLLVPPERLDEVPRILSQLKEGRHIEHYETERVTKDGRKIQISLTISPIKVAGKIIGASTIARDVTERKKAEQEKEKLAHDVGERIKELNCLYTIAKIAAVPDISLEEICQKTAEIIPPSWQYPEITCARILVHYQEYKTINFKKTKWLQAADIIEYGDKAGRVEVYYLEERPVLYEGPFLKEERDLIEGIAERLGNFTERQRADELSVALDEINNAINSTLDFDHIMQKVVIEATKMIGAEACGILLREGEGWGLHYVYGFPQDLVRTNFTDEELSHVILATKTKQLIVVDDALIDKRVNREVMEAYGVRSLLTIPLIVKEEAFGALVFSYQSAPVGFTDPEINFAEKLGVSVSLAIQNAKSHEITEQSLSDTEALHRLAARFTQTLELDDILETGLGEILKAFDIEHGLIYVLDQTGMLVIKRQRQLSPEFIEAKGTISIGEGCAGHACTTKELFAPTPQEHEYICEYAKKLLALDCVAAIPIVAKGNVLGVLELFAPVHRRLSDRERRIAMTMVDQLATAIDNANLYLKQRNIAETLQEALLEVPEKIDGINFGYLYRSATKEAARVGGDFYDLFELENEKVGVIIGDVSGKGLAASTLTSLVKSTIKAYAYENKSPGEVIALTNSVVERASEPSMFVTACFGILDKRSGFFTYCSAGHPPGILRRRHSGKTRVLETKSMVIGIFPDLKFVENTLTLEAGDLLILYTDGVIEARRDKEFFGEDRLMRIIEDVGGRQPNEVPRLILDDVIDFSKTLPDDVAILALSHEKPVPLNRSALPQQITDKILNAETKEAVLEFLTLELTNQLDASGAAVMLIDPEREHLHGEVAKPDDLLPNFEKVTISLSEPLCGPLSVSTKLPLIVDNAHEDPRAKTWLVRYYQAKSLLIVPLLARDEALGSITIIEARRFRHFNEDEVKLAQLLASKAGQAIKRLEDQI